MLRMLCLLAAAVAALALPAAASAAVTCSYDAGQKRIAIVQTGAGNPEIRVRANDSDPNNVKVNVLENGVLQGGNCQDVLRSQTDTVALTETGSFPAFVIEEPEDFIPGGSPEAGGVSEVDFRVDDSAGLIGFMQVIDGDGDGDNMQLGSNGLNYNVDNGANSDADPDIAGNSFTDLVLTGGTGSDVFDASGGTTGSPAPRAVTFDGAGGIDTVIGGAGGDTIRASAGNDFLRGGAGDDMLDYSASTAGVNIDLAAPTPQTGGSLGSDDFDDIEGITGSEQGDVLRGDGVNNDLRGRGGNDTLEGRGGNDILFGNADLDTVSYASSTTPVTVDLGNSAAQQNTGATGLDWIAAENFVGSPLGDDVLGSSGPNVITGGGGIDEIQALAGADRVEARDGGADIVDCGDDADTGVFDLIGTDTVTGCETSQFFTPAQNTPVTPIRRATPPADRSVELIVSAADSQRIGSRGVAVKLECPKENCTVKASASLKEPKAKKKKAKKSATLKLSGKTIKLEADKPKTVRLKLSRKHLRRTVKALRKKSKRTVSILATATDAAGNKDVEDDKVGLKAPPKPKKK